MVVPAAIDLQTGLAPQRRARSPNDEERRVHRIFEAGILLKGAHAIIECAGGIALALTTTAAISRLADRLAHDFIGAHLISLAQGFSAGTKHFYAFYLVSHGVIQLLLVIGLLRAKLWAYPASLAVMSLFVGYQLYRYTLTHGIGLILLTIFDLIVIGLIAREYGLVGQTGGTGGSALVFEAQTDPE